MKLPDRIANEDLSHYGFTKFIEDETVKHNLYNSCRYRCSKCHDWYKQRTNGDCNACHRKLAATHS